MTGKQGKDRAVNRLYRPLGAARKEDLETIGGIGANMLVNSDCIVAMKRIASGAVDALITDPPYG